MIIPPEVKFPLLVRPKLRGVHCVIMNGEPLIKLDGRLVELPNRSMADILGGLPAFDGFIVVGDVLQAVCHAVTFAAATSPTDVPVFSFYVVDLVTTGKYAFKERYDMYRNYVRSCRENIQGVWHADIPDVKKLEEFEQNCLFGHYPGIVARDPDATKGGIWSS